jgi:hypothetical protein
MPRREGEEISMSLFCVVPVKTAPSHRPRSALERTRKVGRTVRPTVSTSRPRKSERGPSDPVHAPYLIGTGFSIGGNFSSTSSESFGVLTPSTQSHGAGAVESPVFSIPPRRLSSRVSVCFCWRERWFLRGRKTARPRVGIDCDRTGDSLLLRLLTLPRTSAGGGGHDIRGAFETVTGTKANGEDRGPSSARDLTRMSAFRGLALSSIAAVSHIKKTSRLRTTS